MKKLEAATLPPGLYLVATPIGNLRDITLRALDILAAADVLACEDTRVTGKLLEAHGIKPPKLLSYSDHNADRQRKSILDLLAQGKRVALASDAGTPLVSDPGYKLVRDAIDLGFTVVPLPGANAVLTALQVSGLPSDKFCFLGFLPPKSEARKTLIKKWVDAQGTLVIYETAPRLIDTLNDLHTVLGNRYAAVVRELTKMYEETRRDTLAALAASYEEAGAPKGEIVIVVAPPEKKSNASDEDIQSLLRVAMKEQSLRDSVALVAEQTGISRKRVYDLALACADKEPS